MAVPLHALLPYKGVFVGSGFDLHPVYVFDIQRYKAFFCRKQHELSEDLVQLVFHTASKSVNGDLVRLLIIGQQNKVNVSTQQFLNLAAGINIVYIGVENHLEHHGRMIRTAVALMIEFVKRFKIQTIHWHPKALPGHSPQCLDRFLPEKES